VHIKKPSHATVFYLTDWKQISVRTMQLQQQHFVCGFFLFQLLQGSMALLDLRLLFLLLVLQALQLCGFLRRNQPTS